MQMHAKHDGAQSSGSETLILKVMSGGKAKRKASVSVLGLVTTAHTTRHD